MRRKGLGRILGKTILGTDRTRMMVRVRDGFKCNDCGLIRTPEQAKKEKKRLFDVHHLNGKCGFKNRARRYDRISEMPGMVTLCHKCHMNRHDLSKDGKKVRSSDYQLSLRAKRLKMLKG